MVRSEEKPKTPQKGNSSGSLERSGDNKVSLGTAIKLLHQELQNINFST